MPNLLSLNGILLIRKYTHNWYSIIFVYLRIIQYTMVRFKNGKRIIVSKNNYQEFREELFQQYLVDNGFLITENDGKKMVTTNNSIRLILFTDYINVLDEIFIRKVYGEKEFKDKVVIDIGASIGDTPLYFTSKGAKQVYAFEMDNLRYSIATENIRLNGMEDLINISNVPANSEIVANTILANNLTHVFIKLDCEGCEYEIIKNLPDNIFERIDNLVMEYHSESNPLIDRLSKLGFYTKKKKNVLAPEGLIFASKHNKFK
jgi:tRNA G37 N-methylase Trm5